MQSWSAQRHEEVLLLEAQLLARGARVVRVEHLREVLAADLRVDRAPVLADLERVEVELLGGGGAPQAQEVGGLGAVAGDGHVVRHASRCARASSARGSRPVRRRRARCGRRSRPGLDLEAPDLPRVAGAQPAVGALDLPAVADVLVEDAELVAQAVADRGDVERGERVHVARGEAPEAAVAEAGLLLVLDAACRATGRRRRAPRATAVSRPSASRFDAELRPDQVLGGQIDDRAPLAARGSCARSSTQRCSRRSRTAYDEREVVVVRRRDARELRELEVQLADDDRARSPSHRRSAGPRVVARARPAAICSDHAAEG